LLEAHTDPNLRVFVIWEPVLATDVSAPSTMTLRRITDPRVRQYWDHDRVLSHRMGEYDSGSVVWDYVAVYRPGQRWEKTPPQPVFNGFPVVRAIQGTRSALENLAGH